MRSVILVEHTPLHTAGVCVAFTMTVCFRSPIDRDKERETQKSKVEIRIGYSR